MAINAYASANGLVDAIIKVVGTSSELGYANVHSAFSGDMYDNPTFFVTIAVGPHDSRIEQLYDPDTNEQVGWVLTTTVFADIAMPVMQSTNDAWHAYLHMNDVLSKSDVGAALISSECGTPKFDRDCRAFITRTKFTFELSV